MAEALLVFFQPIGELGWVHIRDGAIIARGRQDEEAQVVLRSNDTLRLVVAIPSEAVALHWIELSPTLTIPQATIGARLAGVPLTAQPMNELHVAVSSGLPASERRLVAFVAMSQMIAWAAELQQRGLDADVIIPDVLLLRARSDRLLRLERNGLVMVRGSERAFAIERDIADLVINGDATDVAGASEFEAELGRALDPPALNLLQGPFARRSRWRMDKHRVRRVALMISAVVFLTLAIDLTKAIRYTLAADSLDAQRDRIIGQTLGMRAPPPNSGSLISQRLLQLGAGAGQFDRVVTALFQALQSTPSVQLTNLEFTEDGTLRANIVGDSEANVAEVVRRLQEQPLAVSIMSEHRATGRPTLQLTIQEK